MLSLCVCEVWYVTKLYVKFVCVRLLYVRDGVWQAEGGRRREAGGGSGPGYRIKNKNPTQSCGEQSNSARHPQKMEVHSSKMIHVCRTSSKFEVCKIKNEAILQDILQK